MTATGANDPLDSGHDCGFYSEFLAETTAPKVTTGRRGEALAQLRDMFSRALFDKPGDVGITRRNVETLVRALAAENKLSPQKNEEVATYIHRLQFDLEKAFGWRPADDEYPAPLLRQSFEPPPGWKDAPGMQDAPPWAPGGEFGPPE